MKKIVFINTSGIPERYAPKPAYKDIPTWYKELPSYMGDGKKNPPDNADETNATIKKCMPVFDVVSMGYLIYTHVDIFVSYKDQTNNKTGENVKASYFQWPSGNPLDFHTIDQAPTHPTSDKIVLSYPKFLNYWGIKTAKGYSSLIIPPAHRDLPFSIFPGIVDTDKYNVPINFPFTLNNPDFSGLIPAGTPIAQIIPIKREKWVKTITEKKDDSQIALLKSRFFDSYKTLFRQQKEYY